MKLRGKNERVGRYETQRLMPKFEVSRQLVTSEVSPMTQTSGFGYVFITPTKMTREHKSKHYRYPLVKQRRMLYYLFGKGQGQDWPRGQGQVKSPQVMD